LVQINLIACKKDYLFLTSATEIIPFSIRSKILIRPM
jgi:hypothetical protein